MTRFIGFRRNRNGTLLYFIVRDSAACTVTINRCRSWTTVETQHCKTFSFKREDAKSEDRAIAKAKLLTDALCRMSPAESLKQDTNILTYGEVR